MELLISLFGRILFVFLEFSIVQWDFASKLGKQLALEKGFTLENILVPIVPF